MRLIDADIMAEDESEAYIEAQTSGKISPITQGLNSVVHRKIQQLIADTPTIDPETLPIVRRLREELARVTAERDAAVNYRLPVKPGDKVYQQNGADVYELEVKKIIFDCGHIAFDESAIGSSIYLSEEAAKAALDKHVEA